MTDTSSERLLDRLAESMDRAQAARVRDYLNSGKDNYDVDRRLGDQILKRYPSARAAVHASRAFHRSATETLAKAGIRQFLDIGGGLDPSVHLVAQREIPDAEVVYVDNDPIVLCHGRAESSNDTVSWCAGDLDNTQAILDYARTRLDFTQPVAVSLVGVIELVPGQSHAVNAVRSLLAPLVSGSALVLCTATADHAPEQIEDVAQLYAYSGILYRPRTRDQVAAFFERLVLDEPGIFTPVMGKSFEAVVSAHAGVGRKP